MTDVNIILTEEIVSILVSDSIATTGDRQATHADRVAAATAASASAASATSAQTYATAAQSAAVHAADDALAELNNVIERDVIANDRGALPPYRFTIHGSDGRVVLGVTEDGRIEVGGLDLQTVHDRADASPYITLFSGPNGALIGVGPDGNVTVNGLTLDADPRTRATARPFASLIEDILGPLIALRDRRIAAPGFEVTRDPETRSSALPLIPLLEDLLGPLLALRDRRIVVRGVDVDADPETRSTARVIAPISEDRIGPLLGADPSRRIVAKGFVCDSAPLGRADAKPYVEAVQADTGAPLALDPKTGAARISLDDLASTWIAPKKLRGNYTAFNLRPDGSKGLVATAQDRDLYVADVYQTRAATSFAAMAIESGGIEILIYIGQSNAVSVYGAPGGPLWSDHAFPHHALMPSTGCELIGNVDLAATANATLFDFAALAEPLGYGEAPIGMVTEAITRFERDAGLRNPARIAFASAEGSQPIENFFPGTSGHYIYENAIFMLGKIEQFAARYPGALRLGAIFFAEGETYSANWGTTFQSWIDTVVPNFRTAIGQSGSPPIIFAQINTASNSTTPSGVELQQLSVARSRTSPAVSLSGPMYQYQVSAVDNIHTNDIGRMLRGEIEAIVYDRVVRQGLAWNPLWPVAGGVTRSSNVITIPLTLPPGCASVAIDSDWVQSVTNKGFVFQQTGGNSPTISSVAISGTNIVVTLDVAPTGTAKKIRYAMANDANTSTWATGRGQIYSPDPRMSWAYRLGYAVPQHPRHYLVRFEESFS